MGIYSLETSLIVPLKDRPVSNLFVVKMLRLFIATLLTRPLHLNVGSTVVTCLSLDYFVFLLGLVYVLYLAGRLSSSVLNRLLQTSRV